MRDLKIDERYVRCVACGLIAKKSLSDPKKNNNDISPRSIQEEVEIAQKRSDLYKYILKRNEGCRNEGKILDIGCGSGFLLKLAKEAGWKETGIEMAPQLASYARDRGLNVHNCSLREKHFPDDFFDLVTLINVLDFVADPYTLLLEIKRILKKNGKIYLRLPNSGVQVFLRRIHNILSIFGTKKLGEFFNYGFAPGNIRLLLEKTGFKNIDVENSILVSENVYGYGIPLIRLLKIAYDYFGRAVYYLSLKRILISTSLFVSAAK